MNTIRSRYTATVAVLVVAIGGRVASSMDNIELGRKCCPVDRLYVPEARFCKLSGTDVDEYRQRLLNQLDRGFRVEANVSFNVTYYPLSYCYTTEVLVDVPAKELSGLMEALPFSINWSRNYCFDLTPSDELVAKTCWPLDQYCGRAGFTCVNKCYDLGYMMAKYPRNILHRKERNMPFTLSVYETDADGSPAGLSNNTVLPYQYGQIDSPCTSINMIDNSFKLTTDGNLHLINEGVKWMIPDTKYCLEYYDEDGIPEAADLRAFVCTKTKPPVSFLFWFKTLSVVCLVLTLIVYGTLPYLRNAQGYYVMFYMACHFVYLVCIMIYSLVHDNSLSPLCLPFGYFFLFTTLTTCCWLNVICFDIYWMLRYNNSTNRNTSKSVRTIMYHIYCWGFSSTIVSTGYLFQHSQNKTLQKLAPDIGIYRCFFFGLRDYGALIFYWLPSCGTLTVNLILFLLTAMHCSRVKSEINKFRRTNSKIEMFLVYREKFVTSVKLFLVFGMPFLFSMLCELFRIEEIIRLIIDSINCLQGVYIFIIFVSKRKVIMEIRNKFRRSIVHSHESTPLNNISGLS